MIARHWQALEPMAALCKQEGIPVRFMRDRELLDLHDSREGEALLTLLKGQQRSAKKLRVIVRFGALSRWFKKRYAQNVDDPIAHPYRAMLAQFIIESESAAPGCQTVVSNLIEALYDFRSGSQTGSSDRRHAPLLLLTAHRAKGLEFDHVLILDAGGWQKNTDDERRLFYVAMTRARKTLTLCARQGLRHAFIHDCAELCFKSTPAVNKQNHNLAQRSWLADASRVVLSWPGYFAADKAIHGIIAGLDYGSELSLRRRSDGKPGWEITDRIGVTVTRMARAFTPPDGQIVAVRVAAIMIRHKKPQDAENIRCDSWEVVIPEILYLPEGEH